MGAPDRTRRDGIDALAAVLRKRAPLLRLLADAPRDQRDLRDELGVSRSTVYKSIRELTERGIVTDRNGAYDLTGFGRLAWQRHNEYAARLGRLDAGRRLIETLPDGRRFPPTLFERGRIIVPGRHAPERPLERLEAVGGRADHIRAVSPSGLPRFLSALHEDVDDGLRTATIVIEADALARLRDTYDRFPEAVATDGLEMRRIDSELRFAFVLFDDAEIGLFGYDDGVLIGAVFSTDDDALAWGARLFDRFYDRSVEI